jgi:F-type H+-transporting ATPase subunit gamma
LGRKVEGAILDLRAAHPSAEMEVIAFGKKAVESLRRMNRPPQLSFEQLAEDPNEWPLFETLAKVESQFRDGSIDEVHIVFTKFKSALSSAPVVERLLPLDSAMLRPSGKTDASERYKKLLFEPTVEAVFNGIIPRVFRALVLQGALDAKASEHGSRMAAMDAATKNAGDLIKRLQLKYNKLRQSGITSELLDIIGGSEALG